MTDFLRNGGQSADNPDFTVCIIRCVYRAELILAQIVFLSYKLPCPTISNHKRYIHVPRSTMELAATVKRSHLQAVFLFYINNYHY